MRVRGPCLSSRCIDRVFLKGSNPNKTIYILNQKSAKDYCLYILLFYEAPHIYIF